jgi:hypothetical protein
MPVSFNELIDAFLFVNSGGFGNDAFVDKKSGKIYWRFGHDDEMNEELPDDIEAAAKYIPVPDKRELDLGKPLVLDFTRQYLADDFDQVARIFSRRAPMAISRTCSSDAARSINGTIREQGARARTEGVVRGEFDRDR